MWQIAFYDRRIGEVVQKSGETLKDLYYEVAIHADVRQPTFREEVKVGNKTDFNYDIYNSYMMDGNEGEADNYYNKYKQLLTDEDYYDCIFEDLEGLGIKVVNFGKEGRYYLDSISGFDEIGYKKASLVIDWLKANGKLGQEVFTGRYYTKNKKFYEKIDKTLGKWEVDYDDAILEKAFAIK